MNHQGTQIYHQGTQMYQGFAKHLPTFGKAPSGGQHNTPTGGNPGQHNTPTGGNPGQHNTPTGGNPGKYPRGSKQ
ncbi:MAG TPA: hypothetical protein VEF35_04100 [Candidatus Bathyarchaeia archaeon]|nr:hypothetical protein [Candidatus Bathyarchaeia archaeon]